MGRGPGGIAEPGVTASPSRSEAAVCSGLKSSGRGVWASQCHGWRLGPDSVFGPSGLTSSTYIPHILTQPIPPGLPPGLTTEGLSQMPSLSLAHVPLWIGLQGDQQRTAGLQPPHLTLIPRTQPQIELAWICPLL